MTSETEGSKSATNGPVPAKPANADCGPGAAYSRVLLYISNYCNSKYHIIKLKKGDWSLDADSVRSPEWYLSCLDCSRFLGISELSWGMPLTPQKLRKSLRVAEMWLRTMLENTYQPFPFFLRASHMTIPFLATYVFYKSALKIDSSVYKVI